jgi:hypothetical protein
LKIENSVLLPLGHRFSRRYIIQSFKENNSHADVYEIQDLKCPTQKYIAHVFLSGQLPGNWSSAKTKRMKRFRAQRKVVADFKTWDGRTVFVMKDEEKQLPKFSLEASLLANEFPPLPLRADQCLSTGMEPSKQNRNDSYAEVASRLLKKKRKRTRKKNKREREEPCFLSEYKSDPSVWKSYTKVRQGKLLVCKCSSCTFRLRRHLLEV